MWLKAKLVRRDGDLKQSAALMAEVVKSLPQADEDDTFNDYGLASFNTSAYADLGTIQVSRGEFIKALDAFLVSDETWDDASFVAERVLTTKELLDYTAQHYPPPSTVDEDKLTSKESDDRQFARKFRSMVGRRLMRESRYEDAKAYLDPKLLSFLERYIASLKVGNDEKAGKMERARALFSAAWVARYHGMELMGTEGGPDSASSGGDFTSPNTAMERLTGRKQSSGSTDEDELQYFKPGPATFAIPVSAVEKKRLAATKLAFEKRYHYRHIAAGLAWKAAALMPDQSEETADVLNTAGNWLKGLYPKEADRFVQAIEKRCYKTKTGIEIMEKHWFVGVGGPWYDEELAKDPPDEN
jgi:tetratricopeptide (TPR) repeat protein